MKKNVRFCYSCFKTFLDEDMLMYIGNYNISRIKPWKRVKI